MTDQKHPGEMFMEAARLKLRFQHPTKGSMTVEDLYHKSITVTVLDRMYRPIAKQLKESGQDSLISTRTHADQELQLQADLIKFFYDLKRAEAEAKAEAAKKAEMKRRVNEAIASKREEEFKTMPLEELEKLAETL